MGVGGWVLSYYFFLGLKCTAALQGGQGGSEDLLSETELRKVAFLVGRGGDERLLQPPQHKGFRFLVSQFSADQLRVYLGLEENFGYRLSGKERSKERNRIPLFKLHPDLLLEMSRTLTLLLRQAENPRMALREKDIIENIWPILRKMTKPGIIDYRDNAFMGFVEELRVAAHYVEQGYEIVRLHYDFSKAPRVPDEGEQPIGEIDIILEDPQSGELVMIEVKSHFRGSGYSDQFKRYTEFIESDRLIIYDHRVGEFRSLSKAIMFSSEPFAENTRKKYEEDFPLLEFIQFDAEKRRDAVFPWIHRTKVFRSSY